MPDPSVPDYLSRRRLNHERRMLVVAAISRGATIAEAAELAGVTAATVYRYQRDFPSFRDRIDAARRQLAERRARKAHLAVEEILANPEHPQRLQAAKTYLQAYDPDFHERSRLELTGPDGGPVALRHERRLTLGDLLAYTAEPVDGPQPGARRELPAAGPLLPEPADDQPAAG